MITVYSIKDITAIFYEGEDDWGEPVATVDVEMKGYVDWKTHWVRDIAGEKVISRGIAYVKYSRAFNHKDRVKIDGVEYAILDVHEGTDFSDNHQELHLQ